jgi:hypothetical protein
MVYLVVLEAAAAGNLVRGARGLLVKDLLAVLVFLPTLMAQVAVVLVLLV